MSFPGAEFPTGIVTLVFTDIEGSVEFFERFQDAFTVVLEAHNRLLRETLAQCNGCEVRTIGDAFFLAFASPTDAVDFAITAQQRLRALDWSALLHGVADVRVRIGIHTGEAHFCIHPNGAPDYLGTTPNRAARVSAAAHGGQILLSSATYEAAGRRVGADISFRDCGSHRLKGMGEAHLWQALHPALPADFPPLRTLSPERHNLPLPPTPFVGREQEIAEWKARLLNPNTRLMTLTGFGGMGKTRAALHLMELCADSFPDGVWWVPLEEEREAEGIYPRLARQLRLFLEAQTPVREQVYRFLRERRLLLALDCMEQVQDGDRVVRELLDAAPDIKILVTSRRALELLSEQAIELAPLSPVEAEQLFLERAQARLPDFTRTGANTQDIAELCRRLDGLPLAIELAASRISAMTPREACARLNERFRFLQTRATDLPPRQRVLHTAIDWSYDLLSDTERYLFAQLSVFSGGFTLEDAEPVCDVPYTLEGIVELRSHSLLRATVSPETQQTRYQMLDALHEYATEKRRESEEAMLRKRHAEYFLLYGRERIRRFRTKDEAAALRQLDAALANLRSALAWAEQFGTPEQTAELALVTGMTLQRGGLAEEAERTLETGLTVLQSAGQNHTPLYAELLRERAGIALDALAWDEARRLAQQALDLSEQAGEARGMALALNLLGDEATRNSRDFDAARGYFARAQPLFAQAGSTAESAIVLNNSGLLELEAGQHDQAQAHFQEALRLRRACGDRRGLAETLTNLGALAFHQKAYDEAERHYAEALRYEHELQHLFGIARACYNLGEVAEQQGENLAACCLFAASERLFDDVHSSYAAFAGEALVHAAASCESATLCDSLRRAVRFQPRASLLETVVSTNRRSLPDLLLSSL